MILVISNVIIVISNVIIVISNVMLLLILFALLTLFFISFNGNSASNKIGYDHFQIFPWSQFIETSYSTRKSITDKA